MLTKGKVGGRGCNFNRPYRAGVTEFERELRGIGHKSVTSAQRVNDKIAVAKSFFSRMTKLSTALSAVSIRELQVAQEECEAATIKIDKREYLQRLIQALLLKKSWLNLQGLHQYLQEVVGDSSVPGVGDFWSDILCYANRLNQQTPPRRVDELDRMLKAMIYVLSSNTICNN